MYFKDCMIWTYYPRNNKCYRRFAAKWLWADARERCREFDGGELASIPDLETQNFLKNNLSASNCWFGGKRSDTDKDTWEWLDGTPWSWTNWRALNPRAGADQRLYYIVGSLPNDWASRSKSEKYSFMCQYDKL